jgi:hypothetical protein
LLHQIAFLQKQIAIMQKTYHTHYTNHANTVAHLQHKNAELNKALVIVKPPPALPPAPTQKSLEFYSRDREHDRDHWCHHHSHCHHNHHDRHQENIESYDNGDHLLDEDDSLRSEDHVPLLPIPQHQYSIVSVHAPMNEVESVEMDHPGHPPNIPPLEPHPEHPPIIPPPGPSLPLMPPPPIPSTMQSYIPQKKRMSLVL